MFLCHWLQQVFNHQSHLFQAGSLFYSCRINLYWKFLNIWCIISNSFCATRYSVWKMRPAGSCLELELRACLLESRFVVLKKLLVFFCRYRTIPTLTKFVLSTSLNGSSPPSITGEIFMFYHSYSCILQAISISFPLKRLCGPTVIALFPSCGPAVHSPSVTGLIAAQNIYARIISSVWHTSGGRRGQMFAAHLSLSRVSLSGWSKSEVEQPTNILWTINYDLTTYQRSAFDWRSSSLCANAASICIFRRLISTVSIFCSILTS